MNVSIDAGTINCPLIACLLAKDDFRQHRLLPRS